MKSGHHFPEEHGFTGSANPSADMRPKIPGYKRGGMMTDEMPHESDAESPPFAKEESFKHGGKVHGHRMMKHKE